MSSLRTTERHRRRRKLGFAGLAGLVAVLVATTASGSALAGPAKSTAAGVGGYRYAGSAAETRAALAAGAKAAGAKASVPKGKTIGVIQLSGTSSQSIGALATAKQIAKIFGWKVAVCDPNFDPQKVAQCATSIVAQSPTVIFSVSTNTGAMGSAYKEGISKGITWINIVSGAVPVAGLKDYGTDGFALAKIVDDYIVAKMRASGQAKPHKLFAIGAPTVGIASANSGKQLARDVKRAGDVKLINHDLDLSNAVQDTLNTTRQTLQQNPDLGATWTLCDFCLPLMAQVVGQLQPNKRTTVVAGLYANPQAINGIRKGTIDAVSDLPWVSSVWIGMDQVFQHLARKAAVAGGAAVYKKYPLPFMKPYVIEKKNVRNFGSVIPVYGPDYQSFFMAKWRKEFGIK
jgi:ABC-type sugar transport system substrate-binding protein